MYLLWSDLPRGCFPFAGVSAPVWVYYRLQSPQGWVTAGWSSLGCLQPRMGSPQVQSLQAYLYLLCHGLPAAHSQFRSVTGLLCSFHSCQPLWRYSSWDMDCPAISPSSDYLLFSPPLSWCTSFFSLLFIFSHVFPHTSTCISCPSQLPLFLKDLWAAAPHMLIW